MPKVANSISTDEKHERFTTWARNHGCFIDKVKPTAITGKGLGIIATKIIKPGEAIVSIPPSALITRKSLPKGFLERLENISIHGALAAYLSLDSLNPQSFWSTWMSTWPSKDDFMKSNPIYWDPELQDLLPEGAQSLLKGQRRNLNRDLGIVRFNYPKVSEDAFTYHWMIVNTRSFYYEYPGDEKVAREDRMALCPFVDYFNHSDQGCTVSFNPNGFEVKADREYVDAEEVFVSYGNHSNDFLLAEYGFIMESNKWDEIKLDSLILPQFSAKQRERLKHAGFLGNYVLDQSEICYRTEVAIRLLVLPVQIWHRFVNGASDGSGEQEVVNRRICSLLTDYQTQISVNIAKVAAMTKRPQEAHKVLLMRWNQISVIIERAIRRLK